VLVLFLELGAPSQLGGIHFFAKNTSRQEKSSARLVG